MRSTIARASHAVARPTMAMNRSMPPIKVTPSRTLPQGGGAKRWTRLRELRAFLDRDLVVVDLLAVRRPCLVLRHVRHVRVVHLLGERVLDAVGEHFAGRVA